MENTKLAYINSLEKKRDKFTEITEKPKYFITFPYPYMNGKLHLGHLFSISKADFMAHYKEMQGYNVLFPLSFHCTGMPISASAKKLEEELNGKVTDISTKQIIESLGFTDVAPFTDPYHWIKTFPSFCEQTLRQFGAAIDWRRSFITTDMNKYYDSFIRWQFEKLREMKLLSFGKRYSIFCPKDKQPCLDHDRRKGEGVKPVQVFFYKVMMNDKILLVKYKNEGIPQKVVCGQGIKLVCFTSRDVEYVAEEYVYENLKQQASNIKYISDYQADEVLNAQLVFDNAALTVEKTQANILVIKNKNTVTEQYKKEIEMLVKYDCISEVKVDVASKISELSINTITAEDMFIQTEHFVSVWVPEEEVISRSGGICVVSLIDQWYANYNDLEWKEKVKKCLEQMECDTDTRTMLADGIDWINKWGVSRSFGLGTRLPWDPQYLIESLSDSTIYMAMYTFKHYMYDKYDGSVEIFPSDKLSSDVWEFIFSNKPLSDDLLQYAEILNNCRNSFLHFYPVDLRVSGKDLIKNHLLFFLFNHVAIFDEKHWPKRIFTNGFLMLNSDKMSKSTGNFLTVEEAFSKYGVCATRMTLAVCGDTNEDANFLDSSANAFILKLSTWISNIEELNTHECTGTSEDARKNVDYDDTTCNSVGVCNDENVCDSTHIDSVYYNASKNNINKLVIESVSYYIRQVTVAYEKMKYSEVIKYGFFEMSHLCNTYKILNGNDDNIVRYIYKTMTQLLYPIIPDLCRHLIDKHFGGDYTFSKPVCDTSDIMSSFSYVKEVCKKIVKSRAYGKSCNVEICVGNELHKWKQDVISLISDMNVELNIPHGVSNDIVVSVLRAASEIYKKHNVTKKKGDVFTSDYLKNSSKYNLVFDEFGTLNEFKSYIVNMIKRDVKITANNDAELLDPTIKFT